MNERGPKKGDRKPIPPQVLQPGTAGRRRFSRRRSPRSVLIPVLGFVAVVVLALAIVGALVSSDNGSEPAPKPAKKAPSPTTTGETPTAVAGETTTSPEPGSTVSLQLHATADVWVCLVDDTGRPLVNSETLTAGEKRGPFDGRGFEVTFGNGSVRMTVDDQPADVPAVSEPIGFRIAPGKVRRLDPSSQPSCT